MDYNYLYKEFMQTDKLTTSVDQLVNQPYKYGFKTDIESEQFPKGVNEDIIRLISSKKNEPEFMLNFRLKAYKIWKRMSPPTWAHVKYPDIDYNDILYYAAPKTKKQLKSLDDADPELLKTFEKLGIPLSEQKRLANVAVDAIFDSVSIGTTFQKELKESGVIFCSISEALQKYPDLMQKYLGAVVPIGDNYFTALNSAVFSDGSFCYIPRNVKCPLELSTYFRINNEESGQFERTLIIAEDNSCVSYLEGCTAPQFDRNQLHAAVVELVALNNSEIKYSTVQNWYSGDTNGNGGIYNFVTKRGLCSGNNSKISWTQVETGSAITWKYPSCILAGKQSVGEFYSVALTNNYQEADTGTKMIHLAPYTKSKIISKGISASHSKNSYRGLVKVSSRAKKAWNYSQCDSLLIGNQSQANTYPYIQVQAPSSKVEHEASTSKIGEEQIFYLLQRGIGIEEAINLMISGFCKEVFNVLPMEFALEADKLLGLKLEGSVG
nr:putative ABC transporter [Cavernulicola chilensis]